MVPSAWSNDTIQLPLTKLSCTCVWSTNIRDHCLQLFRKVCIRWLTKLCTRIASRKQPNTLSIALLHSSSRNCSSRVLIRQLLLLLLMLMLMLLLLLLLLLKENLLHHQNYWLLWFTRISQTNKVLIQSIIHQLSKTRSIDQQSKAHSSWLKDS